MIHKFILNLKLLNTNYIFLIKFLYFCQFINNLAHNRLLQFINSLINYIFFIIYIKLLLLVNLS